MQDNPEREILLKLLRAEPVPAAAPEQWPAILRLARQHGVESLLYRQLQSPGWKDQLPPETWQTLRADYMLAASQNSLLYHELGKVLSALHQADIPVIPLKGAFLAEHIYGNIALRPMVDVDLLVRQADLWRVEQILAGLDYLRTLPGKGEDASRHVGYQHAQVGLSIEIHWNLVQEALGLHVDIRDVWKRTRPAQVAGVEVSILSPEDLLLHLCIHAADHAFGLGLRPVCDLTETLRHDQGADRLGLSAAACRHVAGRQMRLRRLVACQEIPGCSPASDLPGPAPAAATRSPLPGACRSSPF